MATQPRPSAQLVFGPFEVNTGRGELLKHGVRVRLPPQPFQILLALLERPGDVVTREQLRQQLWNDGTFVDFEHGLNAAINKLRQALQDSAESPRYIETLPGRGYRFVGAVEHRIAPAQSSLASGAPLLVAPRRVWSRVPWWGWIAIGLLAAAVVRGVWVGTRQQPSARTATPIQLVIPAPAGVALEPAGARQGFAISPDGARLAFTALGENGLFSIWVRDLAKLEAHRLPGTEGTHSLFWSPESRYLYFSVRGSLRCIGLDGGSYQVVHQPLESSVFGIGFLRGQLLVASGGQGGTLLVPTTAGSAPTISAERTWWPQVLPDGEHLLEIAFDDHAQHFRARVERFGQPGSARDLFVTDSRVVYAPPASHSGPGHLLYLRAGNLLAQPFDATALRLIGEAVPLAGGIFSFAPTGAADFSVSSTGVLVYQTFPATSQIAWFDRTGRLTQAVGRPGLPAQFVRLSADRRQIVAQMYDLERGVTDIWVVDAASGQSRRVVSGPGLAGGPIWSPDSQHLVYGLAQGRGPKLFLRGLGEKDAGEPLPPAAFQSATDWSPDGRFVAYTTTAFPGITFDPGGDEWLIDLAAGRKAIPILNTQFLETSALFSPDGKWLAFLSNESGQAEAYVQAFTGGDSPHLTGTRTLVSRGGAMFLRWRPDGKELYYLGADGHLYAVPIKLATTLKAGPPVALFHVPLEDRAVLPTEFGLDVSADGQRFLMATQAGSERPEFVVVQNWESMLGGR